MTESASYRQAHAALSEFAEKFAGPVVELLKVLEQAADAETVIAEATARRDAVLAEAADAEQRLVRAQQQYDANLEVADQTHTNLVAELDRALVAHQATIQAKIDALYANLASAQARAKADLEMYTTQIDQRREEQRALDVKINHRRQLLADLTGKLVNAGIDPLVVQ